MDIKTFAEDDFDPKKWINKVWGSSGNQEKEVFLANAVTRLQLYMKQLTNSLDETTTQIVTSVPRILQDASSLQLEGALLQQKLVSLEQMVRDVEEQTGHSIESLQRIDYLKSKLENAASTLREADKWTALAIGLEDVLEAGVPTDTDKLAELAKQVAAMTASLEVLSEAPDSEAKRAQLETLYNKLEAAITPPLIEALTQMNAERSAVYVTLFASMSRLVPACRCWRRAAAARLAAAWRRLEAPRLDALTTTLAKEAPHQVEWLTNVLKTEAPLAELIRLYTDLLLSLDPSPTKVVSANLKLCSTPEEGLLMLTDLRSDIDEFVRSIRAILDAPRMNKETVAPATMREFYRAVYAPLRELLPRYCELQTQLLLAHLDEPQLKQEDLLEHARAILSVSERCDGWMAAAYSRSKKIGGAAAYKYYVAAVESLISALCLLISTRGRHLEASVSSPAGSSGVLSNDFPAALLLETAAALLLDTVAARHEAESKDEVSECEAAVVAALQEAPEAAEALRGAAPLRRARDQLRAVGRAILRAPVTTQLDKIPTLGVWSNNDALSTELPDFAFPPQEYITEIGQYLMTLPQHLEMHITEKQAPWQFLSEVCTHTCDMYAEKILNIRNMDALGTKRCLTDIVYLSSVVEDLGSSVTPALRNLERSLRAATPHT